MTLIDRYIYAVTKHLPKDISKDVDKELRTNIEDMLPENPSEDDIIKVLKELGNPKELANQYLPIKRYLIGPRLYDNYLSVLKMVIGITVIVFLSITILDEIFNPPIDTTILQMSIKFLVNIIASSVEGVFQAFVWVTLVFAILEKSGVNEGNLPWVKKKWSPEDLPDLPIKKRKIHLGEAVFSMFFTIFLVSILYFHPEFMSIYTKGDSGFILLAPLFVIDRLQFYIPVILLLTLFQFIIFVWQFISKDWNFPLAIVNTIYNAAVCVLIITMINDTSLFSEKFIAVFNNLLDIPFDFTLLWKWIFAATIIVSCFVDSISSLIKCKK